MNYVEKIFSRADIQQIREFLLRGVEARNIDRRPYIERTEYALKRVTDQLHEVYPEQEDFEKAVNLVYMCVGAFEDVYMEIGLQAGTILAAQVCQNLKTAFEGE